jgi:hypothetical protein
VIGFNWKGDELLDKVSKATALAIDQTTAAAVIHAKSNHRWNNITGTLEGSYQMREAKLDGDEITGEWGSFDVNYAAPVEVKSPALRPAADVEYPKLAGRIARLLE